jgi:hypothetical protein
VRRRRGRRSAEEAIHRGTKLTKRKRAPDSSRSRRSRSLMWPRDTPGFKTCRRALCGRTLGPRRPRSLDGRLRWKRAWRPRQRPRPNRGLVGAVRALLQNSAFALSFANSSWLMVPASSSALASAI